MLKETTGGNSRVRFLWNDQIGGRNDVSTGEIQYLQWNHVVGVYDGTTQEIYLNGSRVSSVANQGAITFPSNPFRIGHEDRPEVAGFAGRIDDVYIYDRALSPAEVSTLYAAVPEPTTATLMALGLLGLAMRGGKRVMSKRIGVVFASLVLASSALRGELSADGCKGWGSDSVRADVGRCVAGQRASIRGHSCHRVENLELLGRNGECSWMPPWPG